VRRWRRNLALLAALLPAAVLLLAGCGAVPARTGPATRSSPAPPAATRSSATPSARSAPPAVSGSPVWLDSLQMTSATTGWALRWTQSPAVVDDGYLAPARTTDGARTWTSVTPAAARPLLATPDAQAVLRALDSQHAWLAVTAATTDSSSVHLTEVFATADGGRTWTESAPLKVPDYAYFLSFADPEHGWLLIAYGGTMGQEPIQLYRTSDGGLRWSLAAQTPQTGTGSNGLPVTCDKSGLAFATASVGWVSGACFSLPDALLVSRDGGVTWASQPLPVSAGPCRTDECEVFGPQFVGRTGFLVIDQAPAAPDFLVSQDLGATWRSQPLPPGAGKDPWIQFFSPLSGVLVSAGPQGVIGPVFYTTADGGRAWTAVRQGRSFTQLGIGFDFVSAQTGFAWVLGADATVSAPAMYRTTDSGRTWVAFTPRLAATGGRL
jgi:photosystem II stability/assembly factor-like uncharacterized protein